MALVVKLTEGKKVPEGRYLARLDGIKEFTKSRFPGTLQWTFTIYPHPNPEVSGATVNALSGSSLTPKTKLFLWVNALGAAPTNVGEAVDLEALVGKACQIKVKESNPTVKNGQMITYSNIAAIAPISPEQKAGLSANPAQYIHPKPKQAATVAVSAPVSAPVSTPSYTPPAPIAEAEFIPTDELDEDESFDF